MEARMKNPAALSPGAFEAIVGVSAAVAKGGLPEPVLHLSDLRASQINGGGVYIVGGVVLATGPAKLISVSTPWPHGATRPTSPTPNAPRSRSPKP
jgi:hypothetical protein